MIEQLGAAVMWQQCKTEKARMDAPKFTSNSLIQRFVGPGSMLSSLITSNLQLLLMQMSEKSDNNLANSTKYAFELNF